MDMPSSLFASLLLWVTRFVCGLEMWSEHSMFVPRNIKTVKNSSEGCEDLSAKKRVFLHANSWSPMTCILSSVRCCFTSSSIIKNPLSVDVGVDRGATILIIANTVDITSQFIPRLWNDNDDNSSFFLTCTILVIGQLQVYNVAYQDASIYTT